jgi:hypothetical protein
MWKITETMIRKIFQSILGGILEQIRWGSFHCQSKWKDAVEGRWECASREEFGSGPFCYKMGAKFVHLW